VTKAQEPKQAEIKTTICPCGSGNNLKQCCEQYIKGDVLPPTPEALMRSRYTAFTLEDIHYIKNTMKGKALLKADIDETSAWMGQCQWLNLEVVKTQIRNPKLGMVHFIATYEQNGEKHKIEEISEFKKIGNKWFYTQGRQLKNIDPNQKPKVGRNEPCTCGSGKKFKQCCG